MHFTTSIDFHPKLRLTVAGDVDLPDETTWITHVEIEGDPSHENVWNVFSHTAQYRIHVMYLQAAYEARRAIFSQSELPL